MTYHNDNARPDQNVKETILTTANVGSATFGKINSLSVGCKVDEQPLDLSNLQNVGGGTHNVLYVATEHLWRDFASTHDGEPVDADTLVYF